MLYEVLTQSPFLFPNLIHSSYRKLALKWHPDRHNDESKKKEAESKFKDIGEAFSVLSDKEKRRVYDLGGEDGVRAQEAGASFPEGGRGGGMHGFSGFPGGGAQGFSFGGGGPGGGIDPADIFKQFFGTGDPFAAESGGGGGGGGFPGMGGGARMGGFPMGGMGGMPGMGHAAGGGGGGGHQQQQSQSPRPKGQPVTHELRVSLEDLYSGTTKKVRITRTRIGRGSESVDKSIPIKAGWKDGTKITFEREGDESPGIEPGDIIFVLATKPHERFTRDGDDLLYTCRVNLNEALCGVRSQLMTLDGRTLPISAPNVTPETVLRIPNEGLMNNKTKQRGDIQVKFMITFPPLNDSQRRQIAQILGGNGQDSRK